MIHFRQMTPEDAAGVTHLVLPGVGAFGDYAEKLRSQKLIDPGDVSDHKVWLLKNTLTQSNN